MTVHRKRPRGRLGGVRHTGIVRVTTTGALGRGGGGDQDLRAAAELIAEAARKKAAVWSVQVPQRIFVTVGAKTADIIADAPPAYPNEVRGVRHPVFGHDRWVTNPHRPFLLPALEDNSDAAMAKYAKKIDRAARKAGWT